MGENSSHAPGSEIMGGGSGGGVRQRAGMGMGDGAMKGDTFGVGPLPGTKVAMRHGSHMKSDGEVFSDKERSGPPGIKIGSGMSATAHSDHGPYR
jgi:hypothetical protein